MEKLLYLKCSCQNCAGHIEFPENGLGQTVPCPHCSQPTTLAQTVLPEKKSRAPLLISTILILLVCSGAVFFFLKQKSAVTHPNFTSETLPQKTNAVPAAPTKKAKDLADLKVKNIELEKTSGSSLVYVIGTLKNDSDYQRFGVKVEFNLLDAQGSNVGTSTDYAQIIEPHQDWNFHALVTDAKAVKAEVGSIKEE